MEEEAPLPALQQLQESLQCSICKEFYDAPVTTPCGHTCKCFLVMQSSLQCADALRDDDDCALWLLDGLIVPTSYALLQFVQPVYVLTWTTGAKAIKSKHVLRAESQLTPLPCAKRMHVLAQQ